MNSNEIVDDRQRGIESNESRGLEGRASKNEILVSQAPGKRKSRVRPRKRQTYLLFVSDGTITVNNFQEVTSLFAKYAYGVRSVEFISSWEQLSALLGTYASIERLILSFHSSKGSIIIGGVLRALNIKEVISLFSGHKPKIREIDFESCNVGSAPHIIIPFAKLFNAEVVKAWNYYGIRQIVTVPSKMLSDQNIELLNRKYKNYFLKGQLSLNELAKKPGKHNVVLEWFRDEYDESPIPDPPTDEERKKGNYDTRDKEFVPRKNAKEVFLRSENNAKEYYREYGKSPVKSLHHIIIEISR